jgi:hypothetical protein
MVGLFDRCYERHQNAFGPPSWHLASLPDSGSMADQDARTMEALAYVRDVRNRLEADRFADAIPKNTRVVPADEFDEPPMVTDGD